MQNKFDGLSSDFIPFEVPASIDLSPLHAFLVKSNFRWESEEQFSIDTWVARGQEWKILQTIIWGDILGPPSECGGRTHFGAGATNSLQFPVTTPTRVTVTKGIRSQRFVSLLDPASIIGLASLQGEFCEALLAATNRSANSLRRPLRTRPRKFSVTPVEQEQHVAEDRRTKRRKELIRTLHPFYVVGPFRNISSFYSSEEYYSLRRKYPILVTSDVASCFDSIYTHSIDWAINGILSGKDYQTRANLKGSFGSKLDRALQKVNYEETKGIPIGPEFSRTIAEVILQKVDLLINLRLSEMHYTAGHDYDFRRYVDDYFIFASSPSVAEAIIRAMDESLSEYRLTRNVEKTQSYSDDEPDLRGEVKRFLGSEFGTLVSYRLHEPHGGVFERVSREDLIWTRLREISSSLSVELHGVSSYALGIISNNITRLLRDVSIIHRCGCESCRKASDRSMESAVEYIRHVTNVAFRLFESHPSESMALKLGALILQIDSTAEACQWPPSGYWPFVDALAIRLYKYLSLTSTGTMRRYPVLLLLDSVSRVRGLDTREISNQLEKILDEPDLSCLELIVICDLLFRSDQSGRFKDMVVGRLKRYVHRSPREVDGTGVKYLALFLIDCPFLDSEEFCDIFRLPGIKDSNIERFRRADGARGLFDWNGSVPYLDRIKMKARPIPY